jgi:hypothetical protein
MIYQELESSLLLEEAMKPRILFAEQSAYVYITMCEGDWFNMKG